MPKELPTPTIRTRNLVLISQELEDVCQRHDISRRLLTAIIMTESSGNSWLTRFEPHTDKYLLDVEKHAKKVGITAETERIHQKTSWGLIQIMGFTAREIGFTETLTMLCQPASGLEYGCRYLKRLQKRFGKPETKLEWDEDVIASYNAGSPRRLEDGKLVNESYVRKVAKFYKES